MIVVSESHDACLHAEHVGISPGQHRRVMVAARTHDIECMFVEGQQVATTCWLP